MRRRVTRRHILILSVCPRFITLDKAVKTTIRLFFSLSLERYVFSSYTCISDYGFDGYSRARMRVPKVQHFLGSGGVGARAGIGAVKYK